MEQTTARGLSAYYDVDIRNPAEIKRGIVHALITIVGRDPANAVSQEWYEALAYFVRGILGTKLSHLGRKLHERGDRRVYYLSVEYLPGRFLPKSLVDLGIKDVVEQALKELGLSLEELESHEVDTALGNGGLGRLAACFLESLATHNYPGFGYGIRYEFGMFSQSIEDGQQVERPEHWLRLGDPWEFPRPSLSYPIHFNGRVETLSHMPNSDARRWVETEDVTAIAYDLPISGYRSNTVLYLRLWAARASQDFNLRYFNEGDYIAAVRDKTVSETLSKVLYPNDATSMGQELQLKQEYFFTSASVQDILRRHLKSNPSLDNLAEKVAIQLNDTHPSLAIPELMRLLIDNHGHSWESAWEKVNAIFGYTNHTLLPEALETWQISMFEKILPRHLEIIYRINDDHLRRVRTAFPGEIEKLGQLSLVDDYTRRIRMAHLAIAGSRKVNGVSELQTELLRETVFSGFSRMQPSQFIAITNGIAPRQWLMLANPRLAKLISDSIGTEWETSLEAMAKIAPMADNPEFRAAFRNIKRDNKTRLAEFILTTTGETVDPASMFDVQAKRIHEYKRQLLNVLHVVTRYRRIKAGTMSAAPRTVIIAGKAAPGYEMAKQIIRLINDVAKTVNGDPDTNKLLKLVFIPNYRVSVAEVIIPGADLAQHISTAGTEASGTGNMKFALNGALTLGTLDGANIEICKAVGIENMFLFGLTARDVTELRAKGYNPWDFYEKNPELKACIDMIGDGSFSPDDPHRYVGLRDSLLSGGDRYLLLADYGDYVEAQARVDTAFADKETWTRRAIVNVAHMGPFSADRAIHEYAERIWSIRPIR